MKFKVYFYHHSVEQQLARAESTICILLTANFYFFEKFKNHIFLKIFFQIVLVPEIMGLLVSNIFFEIRFNWLFSKINPCKNFLLYGMCSKIHLLFLLEVPKKFTSYSLPILFLY